MKDDKNPEETRRTLLTGALGSLGALALAGCVRPDGTPIVGLTALPAEALTGGSFLTCQSVGTAASPGQLRDPTLVSNGATVVQALGFWAAGDGGGGTFYWSAASTAADDGGVTIQPTGTATGRWLRLYDSIVNVRWFGAKGDGASDDSAAFTAAIAYLNSFDTYVNSSNEGMALFIPAANLLPPTQARIFASYMLYTTTLTLTRRIIIRGVNPTSSILQWTAGTVGVQIAASPGSSANTGAGSELHNLYLVGGYTSWSGTVNHSAHGVLMNGPARILGCTISGFGGDGIHIESAPNFNCNGFYVESTQINSCGQCGIFTHGGNSNQGVCINLGVKNCGLPLSDPFTVGQTRYGIYETGFLGNVYIGCHVEATPGGIYSPGTAQNVGSSSFFCCYTELGSPSYVNLNNLIFGGDWGGGITGNAGLMSCGSNGVLIQPGINVSDKSDPNCSVDTVIGPNDGGHTVLRFSSSNEGHYFNLNYWPTGTDPCWWAITVAGNFYTQPFSISDYNTKDVRDPTGMAKLGPGRLRLFNGFLVGYGTTMRAFNTAAAPPTTGPFYQGDTFFNTAPTVGEPMGWTCVASGTPGTWEAFGAVGASTSASATPSAGTHSKGEIVYNTNPAVGAYVGWVCTAAGTPGTWHPFGAIAT